MDYKKPPLSIDSQIKTLKDRGLHIPDENRATRYLSHIGYYRLSAYMIPFEVNNNDGLRSHKFKK